MYKDLKIAKVKRLVYTDNGFKKSKYEYTGKSYKGSLKGLELSDGVDLNNFGKQYKFNTDINADIKENDILEIDNEEYSVKGGIEHQGVTFGRKMFILVKT